MRICYIHGPGDAYGTYTRWCEKKKDASIPKQTYSGQFYDLIKDQNWSAQVIVEQIAGVSKHDWLTFVSVPRKPYKNTIEYYFNQYDYVKNVVTALQNFKPDVAIISSSFPYIFLHLLPDHIKLILTIHNTYWKPFDQPKTIKFWTKKQLWRYSHKKVTSAVCVSPECARQFQEIKNSSKVNVLIQMPRLAFYTETHKPQFDRKTLLFVGRMEKVKGVQDLLYAFCTLSELYHDSTLTFVGDGSFKNELELSVPPGLKHRVIFLGRCNAEKVLNEYTKSNLIICPTHGSFKEGLATVPLEAAALGIPTLCSSAVPAREYFNNENLVFQEGDIGDLAKKLQILLESKTEYQNVLESTQKGFDKALHETITWYEAVKKLII